jgi:hypothetical protein
MSKKPATSARHASAQDSTAAVDAFLSDLEHPRKAEIQALRELILGIDPSVAEGIKWNAPSYRTTEYFATTNLRAKKGIGLILHLGAKVRELPGGAIAIDDPDKLLTWLGKDRASVEFVSAQDLAEKRAALRTILVQWIAHV